MWPRFTRKVAIESSPPGATVHFAPAADTSRWFPVGTTPTDSVRLPNAVGMYRFEKPGYRTAYSLFHTNRGFVDYGYLPPMRVTLDPVSAPHPEMT
jgi:hypothetical protein